MSDEDTAPCTAASVAAIVVTALGKIAEAAHDAEVALAKLANVEPVSGLKRPPTTKREQLAGMTKRQRREFVGKRPPSEFNLFIKSEVEKIRMANPGVAPTEALTQAAHSWKLKKTGLPVSTPPPSKKEKPHKEKSHKKDKHKDKDKK